MRASEIESSYRGGRTRILKSDGGYSRGSRSPGHIFFLFLFSNSLNYTRRFQNFSLNTNQELLSCCCGGTIQHLKLLFARSVRLREYTQLGPRDWTGSMGASTHGGRQSRAFKEKAPIRPFDHFLLGRKLPTCSFIKAGQFNTP